MDVIVEADANADGGVDAVELASNIHDPWLIAVNATDVFFDDETGSIRKCGTAGCAKTPTLVAASTCAADALAVTATNVYWTDYICGRAWTCSVDGGCGNGMLLSAPSATDAIAWRVVVNSTDVFWSTLATTTADDGSILRCAQSGCAAPSLYWSSPDGVGALAVAAGRLFWTSHDSILSCPLDGCTAPQTVASAQLTAHALAADDTNVFWATETGLDYSIMHASTSGSAAPAVYAKTDGMLAEIVIDGATVFWVDGGAIMTCESTGCLQPKTLVPKAYGVQRFAVDATNVYWTSTNGSVMRLAKSH